jgi:excisionase family DNA binding protein
VTKSRFAELTGLSEDAVRGMIHRGYLPSVKIGKNRLINLALVTKQALEHEASN